MGWTRLKVRRGDLIRSGSTFGKGWQTVRGIRFDVIVTAGGDDATVRFDEAMVRGGPITGEVQYRYIYVRDDDVYIAKSAPSEISIRYSFEAEGASVEIPADSSRDGQINQVWLYRRGAGLDDFYRVAVAEVTGDGGITIEDTMSAVDALIINEVLEPDNGPPPDDIIDIEGPYYDRTFVLTASHLYPSRRLSPDTFSAGQVIRVASEDEEALWVKKALGGLYIGTTKDIHLLSGDGSELPDGTIDFTLRSINIDNPPKFPQAVAQEGNLLIYMAHDGWRAISGAGSELIVGATSLLYKGNARHGVSAVNTTNGRFRAAIAQGQLSAITPEGALVNSSTVLYRYQFSTKAWYRHTYSRNWRAIFRDPDGTLMMGDDAGFVWIMDAGIGDSGADIPVVMWTREDDIEMPFNRKDPHDYRVLIETGGDDASIALHLDHSTTSSMVLTANRVTIGEALFNLSSLSSFRNIQQRITGSFSYFRWASLQLGGHPLPMMLRGHTQPFNFGYEGIKFVSGLQMRICTLGEEVTITPVLDGVLDDSFTVTSAIDEPINHTHMFDFPARQCVEIMMLLAGDVEIYDWKPLVTSHRPLGTKVWDSGPLDIGQGEFIWPREVWMKVEAGADLYVQPWFDGADYGSLFVPVPLEELNVACKLRVPVPRGYKGKIPRFVITSCEPFYPYWFEFVPRQTRAQLEKPPVRVDANFGGKVIT